MSRFSAGLFRVVWATLPCLLSDTYAQPTAPPRESRPVIVVPQGSNADAMMRSLEAQRPAYEAYQKCMAEHQREAALFSAARDVIQTRDQSAMLEAALERDPRLRQQYPGGIEQIRSRAFERYKSLGGPARSIQDVQPIAAPCPTPISMPPMRSAPTGSAALNDTRRLVLPPGGKPPPPPQGSPAAQLDLQTHDPAQQMDIARRYRHSLGGVPAVQDSFAEEMMWYRRAADQGYTPAMKEIGDIYYDGLGTRPDVAEAERWYRRAAEKGNADAMVSLGKLLESGRMAAGRREQREAVQWYRKAAEQGHALGMTEWAMALQNGNGVAVDKSAALEWYRRAAERGNAVSASWVSIADRCIKTGRPLASCL